MQEWLVQISHNHQYLIYLFIIFLAFIEGPILSMVFGVLIKLGFFSFWPIYIALMLGDLIGDVIWYYVGRYFGHRFIKRFGKYFNVTEEKIEKISKIFHKYKHSILLISKITTGFGFALATLFTAGLVRIPFGKYISINIIGQFIWSGILIGVGYFFSNLYIQVNSVLSRMFILSGFVLLIFIFIGFKNYIKNRVEKL